MQEMNTSTASTAGARIQWPDAMKGISILWIVYFHFFLAYYGGGFPWPVNRENFSSFMMFCAPTSSFGTFFCFLQGCCAAVMQRGAQGVGVFVVLSGFGLTYSLLRAKKQESWLEWYRKRLVRLFPMYWAAHLIYLVSPLIERKDPIDYRFLLSFLGDRIVPIDTIFYYINPAWWFFGLLLELYVVFPVLYRLMRKLGPWTYLFLCILFTIASRYMLFGVIHAHANWVQGAFFGCRLWEFATGMVFAQLYVNRPEQVERRLFSPLAFIAGVVLYLLGDYSYEPGFSYSLSDGLMGTGLFIIIANLAHVLGKVHFAGAAIASVGVYSYGLYLLHHPYVIYFGNRLHGLSIPEYVPVATGIIAVITVLSIPVERLVNMATNRVLDRRSS